ncbi:MAG: BlaI/MecI/CopY family transcriptional regulator [Gemmatimonadales bacterium]
MKPTATPTDAELRILQVLWTTGPATVREVHERLVTPRPVGYTTVLKLLQIMAEKRLVTRDDRTRAHRYAAAVSEAQSQRQSTADLLTRVFRGSTSALVQQALSIEPSSPKELARIRAMLDQLERKDRSR